MGIHYTIHSTFCLGLKFSTNKFKERIKSYYVDPLATPGSPNLPQRKGTKKHIEKEIAHGSSRQGHFRHSVEKNEELVENSVSHGVKSRSLDAVLKGITALS